MFTDTYIIYCSFTQRILLVELVEFPDMPGKASPSFPRAVIVDASGIVPGTEWKLKNIC